MTANQLIEFIVIDVEHAGSEVQRSGRTVAPIDRNPMTLQNKQTKFNEKLGLAEVTLARESDFGKNDYTIRCLTHLGNFINAGDHVLGYDVQNANLTELKAKQKQNVPDVIIVKKYYPKRNRAKKRQWKLKTMKKETVDKPKKGDVEKDDEDMERLMQDLEDDPEMRAQVNLYKKDTTSTVKEKKSGDKKSTSGDKKESGSKGKKKKSKSKGKKVKGKQSKKESTSTTVSEEEVDEDDDEDGPPQVPAEELIDELAEQMGTMSTSSSGLKDIRPETGDDEPITFD
jgi:hypothetical protein